MLRIQPLTVLPSNAQRYFDEIAQGLASLYGPAAAQEYLERARRNLSMSLLHPSVSAFVAMVRGEAAGIILGLRRQTVAEISLIHVLEDYATLRLEKPLLEALFASLRDNGAANIVMENASLCALHAGETLKKLGFFCVERELMIASLSDARLRPDSGQTSRPAQGSDWDEVARCIVDAYRGHQDLRIHRDVHDSAAAREFIERVAAGGYGASDPELVRTCWHEGRCVGTILGCLVAPDTGFVLQLVVDAEFRRSGLGKTLLRDLAEIFRRLGLRSVALGVTCANPARQLYASLGFRTLKPVQAHVWWRAGQGPPGGALV